MIKDKNKMPESRPVIDLSGPQGNAFYLLGIAKKYAIQIGKTSQEIESLMKEMKSSDYENLVEVFDRNFGDYVDIYR
jgi:hypothetical protein